MKDTIWHGDIYRLVSPYVTGNDVASLIYVNETQSHAVWFTYLVNYRYQAGTVRSIRLKGLDPNKKYQLQEVNNYPSTDESIVIGPVTLSGDYLMKFGFNPKANADRTSIIIELQSTS